MRVFFRPLAMLIVGAITTGCNTLSPTVTINNSSRNLPPAPLPRYLAGDRVYYKDGHKETVVKSDSQKVKWRRSSTRNHVTWRNFILPRAASESRRNLGSESIVDDVAPDILWPLRVGDAVRFNTRKRTTAKKTRTEKSSLRHWNCSVSETAQLQALVGTFDTYRVDCFRLNEVHKPSRHFVWYYSPELEHPIVKIEYRRNMKFPPKVEEVLALKRGLKWMTSKERKSLRKRLDKVLEHNSSGKSSTWKSLNGRTRVTLTPTSSMKLDNGTYCRNYIQKISYGKLKQTAAGLMCRKSKEHWAVPRKIWKNGNQRLLPKLPELPKLSELTL